MSVYRDEITESFGYTDIRGKSFFAEYVKPNEWRLSWWNGSGWQFLRTTSWPYVREWLPRRVAHVGTI